MYILHVAAGTDVQSAREGFASSEYIETSDLYDIPEPIYDPNDPQRNVQWHLGKIQAYPAWDIIRGDTTHYAIVSIVDTGVYWMHPDLAPNMWINELEDLNQNHTLDNGDLNDLDDDGNGYVDDVIGWDNGANDNDPREEEPTHGTHVAGCASEATDNGINGAGIGFSARIMANKGANIYGQLTAVYPAMIWAAENGTHIINCSWRSLYYNQGEQNIVNEIWNSGVIIVAAAGNEGNSNNCYPAAYNNVFAVAATNQGDQKADFSSYGDFVDVCAPGVAIYATWDVGGFTALYGTSMASPICAGTCALLRAAFPDWTNADIVNTVIMTADNIDDLNPGYERMLGSGRINAYAALASSSNPNISAVGITITLTEDDGDGILNPGESFDLVVVLQNVWADAYNVVGTLRSNENFTVSDSVASYGTIGRGENVDNSADPFAVTATDEASIGPLPMTLNIQADGYEVDREITINLSLNLAGFPLTIPGNIESSPVMFDVDRDGAQELIFGANDDKVYVVESNGQNSPGWPKTVSSDVITGPAIGDLAANGSYQVVAVTKTGSVHAWNADGSPLANFPVVLGGTFFSGPTLVDVDGNGDLEIALGSFTDNKVYLLNHDGSSVAGWPHTGAGKWYGSPATGDIDGDMLSEIVYAGFDSLVHVFNADGSEAAGFPVNVGSAVWVAVATGDIDSDTYPEIAVATASHFFYLINHDGSIVEGFPIDLGSFLRSAPSIADIDGDGALEIILGSNDRKIHIIKANGQELTGFPQESDGAITASPVVGDIDGDSHQEIIFGTGGGNIYGYRFDGSLVRNFPIPGSCAGEMTGSAALGDLDSDGDIDIALGIKGAGSNLMVIDYKENASISGLIWPNFGKDIWRSCNYAEVVTSIDDQSSRPMTFALSQNYPNPFNASTSIRFSLAVGGQISLTIFDLLGRQINVLKYGYLDAGAYNIDWKGTNQAGNVVSSGIYFYRLESPGGTETRRMLLLK